MKTGKRTPRVLLNPTVRITHKVVSPQINHDHRLSCLNETIIPLKKFIVIPISDQKALVSSARLPLMCHHKGPSQMGYPTAKTFTYNNSTGRIFLRLDLLWQNKVVFPLMKIQSWKSLCGPCVSEPSFTEMFLCFERSAPNEVLQHIWKILTARKNAKKEESSCALINYWECRTGKCLARADHVQFECSEVCASWLREEYFTFQRHLTQSVSRLMIVWTYYMLKY